MRILTITSSYPKYPGDTTAPFIESMTAALAKRGHEMSVVLPARSDLSPASRAGVSFHPFRYAPAPRLEVFGYAESLKADVGLRGAAYLVAPIAMLSGAWKVLTLARQGRYDVVHAHWVVPNGMIALAATGRGGIPLVVSLHGSDVFLSERRPFLGRAAARVFARAAAVTACSADLAQRSRALGARTEPVVLPYGVDTDVFRPRKEEGLRLRAELGLGREQPMILAVGRLVHKKGFEVLVDALPRLRLAHPDVVMVVAGRGDLEAPLRRRAAEQDVGGHLRLVGGISRDALPAYYTAATVVAVPSIRDDAGNVDGLPNVLLEAMASGAPLVASRVAGIPDAAGHEREAVLVPERSPEALAAAIGELLSSPERRQELGRRARKRAREAFDWNGVGERLEALFETVQGSRGTPS